MRRCMNARMPEFMDARVRCLVLGVCIRAVCAPRCAVRGVWCVMRGGRRTCARHGVARHGLARQRHTQRTRLRIFRAASYQDPRSSTPDRPIHAVRLPRSRNPWGFPLSGGIPSLENENLLGSGPPKLSSFSLCELGARRLQSPRGTRKRSGCLQWCFLVFHGLRYLSNSRTGYTRNKSGRFSRPT